MSAVPKPDERPPRRDAFIDAAGVFDAAGYAEVRLDWLAGLRQSAQRSRRARCGIGTRSLDLPGPTEQTRARLKPDQLLRLIRSGKLEPIHLAAADEIREVFEALTRQVGARALDLSRPASAGDRRARYAQPIERMPERQRRVYEHRFRPWAQDLSGRTWRAAAPDGSSPVPLRYLGVVIGVIIEGRHVGEFARVLRVRRRRGLEIVATMLRESLELYIAVAGWRSGQRAIRACAMRTPGDVGSPQS